MRGRLGGPLAGPLMQLSERVNYGVITRGEKSGFGASLGSQSGSVQVTRCHDSQMTRQQLKPPSPQIKPDAMQPWRWRAITDRSTRACSAERAQSCVVFYVCVDIRWLSLPTLLGLLVVLWDRRYAHMLQTHTQTHTQGCWDSSNHIFRFQMRLQHVVMVTEHFHFHSW